MQSTRLKREKVSSEAVCMITSSQREFYFKDSPDAYPLSSDGAHCHDLLSLDNFNAGSWVIMKYIRRLDLKSGYRGNISPMLLLSVLTTARFLVIQIKIKGKFKSKSVLFTDLIRRASSSYELTSCFTLVFNPFDRTKGTDN